MSSEPDYVNEPIEAEWYEGEIPDAWRCQYVFEHSHEYEGRDVRGRMCGLLVVGDLVRGSSLTCALHAGIPAKRAGHLPLPMSREEDAYVRAHLIAARSGGAYLGEVNLSHAQLGKTILNQAELPHAWLQHADLHDAALHLANLTNANISQAVMTGVQMQHATLDGAIMHEVKLDRATLDSSTMRGAFMRGAHLREAGARSVVFDGAFLMAAQCTGADLRDAQLATLEQLDTESEVIIRTPTRLTDADLTRALLAGAQFSPETDLSGLIVAAPAHPGGEVRPERTADEYYARNPQEWDKRLAPRMWGCPRLRECENLYRQLKLNFQESGDYRRAGEFYLREMECQRAQACRQPIGALPWGVIEALIVMAGLLCDAFMGAPGWGLGLTSLGVAIYWLFVLCGRRLTLSVMYYLCAYGERPSLVVGWAAAVIVVFALAQSMLGIDSADGPVVRATMGWPTAAGYEGFRKALYFSTVTFTSLGYGDMRPAGAWGQTLAGIEAGLGLALMSLLLVCIVRKFSR